MDRNKYVQLILSIVLILGSLSLLSQEQEKKAEDLTARQSYALIQQNLENPDFHIIDVRTPEEYKDGHLKGAVNIDLNSETFEEDIAKLDISKTYLIYCRSGNRSSHAIRLMLTLEFTHIYHMVNGINEWKAEGLPLEKGDSS